MQEEIKQIANELEEFAGSVGLRGERRKELMKITQKLRDLKFPAEKAKKGKFKGLQNGAEKNK